MRRTAKKTGLLVTSAAAGLATLSQCSAGLLDGLFDKKTGRDVIEKRLPACDCSFGYFSTSWQPWGTCGECRDAGCARGGCRTSLPSVVPGFQPGYSSGPFSGDLPPNKEVWSRPGSVTPPGHPGTFQSEPGTSDDSPTPILMAPQHSRPGADDIGVPADQFESESGNPFPRAIKSNPEFLAPGPGSSSVPQPTPHTKRGLPGAPEPRPGSAIDLPFSPSRSPLDLPTLPATPPKPAVSGRTSETGSPGTGINLPPRRSTSVTIDVPAGSAGSTLSLPDPVRSGSFRDATPSASPRSKPSDILPDFDDALPAVTPGSPATAPEPEPSLRHRPPSPVPFVLPPSTAANQPTAANQHSILQPATHWQAVPQRQQQPSINWRVMPGFYPQPGLQPQPAVRPQARLQMQPVIQRQRQVQRPGPPPSERVIMLPPPPRR